VSDERENERRNVEPPADGGQDELLREPFQDGFSGRTVVGALFVAVVMMPGAIYLGLVAGQTLGPAAEWVTIILFAELARRSFAYLRRQEVYILFYVASSIAAVTLAHVALAGGPFAGPIWNQYLKQSPQTTTIAKDIPDWVVPPADSPGLQSRDLAHKDWWWSRTKGFLSPIFLIALGYVLGRVAWLGMGYLIFRATSDLERLPFPLAPIAAEGVTAVAESTERDQAGRSQRKRSWRWNVFSVGASLGLLFGVVYVLLPVFTGLFMAKPVMLLPIPFVDLTARVEHLLPASLISISFDMVILIIGMILPFKLVLGTCITVLLTSVIGNPILQKLGVFPHWTPGNALLVNQMILNYDFWLSVTLGLALAVALIGLVAMVRAFVKRGRAGRKRNGTDGTDGTGQDPQGAAALPCDAAGPVGRYDPPVAPYRAASKQRGDFPTWVAAGMFVLAIVGFAAVSHALVPDFPVWIILAFGFLWTPLQSYVSARLIGMTGQAIQTPFLKETVFITSGYRGLDIWFAPIPVFDFGWTAQRFRELELTRTKFTSIVKAELLMFPIIFVCSFMFWWFFWRLNQIPSDQFPFAARLWPVAARQAYLIFTANSTDQSLLLAAVKPAVIIVSGLVGLGIFGAFAAVGIPSVVFYGMIGGVCAPVHWGLPLLIGALLGKYYFARKFGPDKWRQYLPVVAAGFSCGMGLAGMTAVALSLIAQCTRELPF
jgi:hypothetical protein